MSDGASRPRKLNGGAALERWFDQHPVEDWPPVVDALVSIQDGTWAEKYRHLDDVTNPRAVVLFVEDDLLLVWRVITEYPDWFRVIYLGHPDDTTFA